MIGVEKERKVAQKSDTSVPRRSGEPSAGMPTATSIVVREIVGEQSGRGCEVPNRLLCRK